GVVQVFTRRGGAGTEGRADLAAGSLGFLQAQAGVSTGGNGFDLAADGAHTQVRGFSATNPHEPFGSFDPDRDGFSQNAGSVRAGWQASTDWRLEALAL
ncbi:MAG TPA: TonB-dependent receptor, partial [Ideonella sp.]|nr:TonB-dependent receptor [Ideonella sp.]